MNIIFCRKCIKEYCPVSNVIIFQYVISKNVNWCRTLHFLNVPQNLKAMYMFLLRSCKTNPISCWHLQTNTSVCVYVCAGTQYKTTKISNFLSDKNQILHFLFLHFLSHNNIWYDILCRIISAMEGSNIIFYNGNVILIRYCSTHKSSIENYYLKNYFLPCCQK